MSRDWNEFKSATPARIGLARTGHTTGTSEILEFKLAHARAREAVRRVWNPKPLAEWFEALGQETMTVSTRANSREEYLLDPDLGRTLPESSLRILRDRAAKEPVRVAFLVTDGLSSPAVESHFKGFWERFQPEFARAIGSKDLIILLPFGRVAASDAVGEALGAELSVIFVGERPGLSSPDSLGVYFTYAPRTGRMDSERNCLSNIRPPEGLSYEVGAAKLMHLLEESLIRRLSGVQLKDEWSPGLQQVPPQETISETISEANKDQR